MYVPLGNKTDYSLHKSLLKINDIISFACNNKLLSIGILDDNLNGTYVFINECIKNNIKPIIGLDFIYNSHHIYLYPKNMDGLTNLFKLNKYCINETIDINKLKEFLNDVLIVLPYESIELFKYFNTSFLSFKNEEERKTELALTDNVIYINMALSKDVKSSKYVNYLYMHENNLKISDIEFIDYSSNILEIKDYNHDKFIEKINIEYNHEKMYIPKYIDNSEEYLNNLANKGLNKRLNGNVPKKYQDRLNYELSIIKEMGFIDYFLIVFDYVRFAIKNDIYVGVGRGSAVSSLVAYSLGITCIDPIEYDLLFERFLNPKRITMPDIDIDFEDSKRSLVVDYVTKKYGKNNVAKIIAYGTLAPREVLRVVAKINNIDETMISYLNKNINPKISLKDNLENEKIKEILNRNSKLKKVYQESFYLEGLKSNISTHAAGVVISSTELTNLVPIIKSGNDYLIGYSKDEIDSLGLIKMDFLSLKTLTIITNTIRLIEENTNTKINLNNIDLNDRNVLNLFSNGDTNNIFQFESYGMKEFLKKLKPDSFNDLIAAVALYRPGPMESIPKYLESKNSNKINYIDSSLENILKETNGVLVYQEQILRILSEVGNYTYQEADIIRRAISKKKINVIEENRKDFINKSSLDYEKSNKLFDLIIPFSEFGFNKSHSVAYTYLAYQMAYLKHYYKLYFYTSILNNDLNNLNKRKELISDLKRNRINIENIDINKSNEVYTVYKNTLVLPFKIIKGLTSNQIDHLINVRGNGFNSIYDFFKKIDTKIINSKVINNLIYIGAFDSFGINRMTLKNNLDILYNYADLVKTLEESLVDEPLLKEYQEYSDVELMNLEIEILGLYITHHPSNSYNDCMKLINIKNNFNKIVDIYVLINDIKMIKTKNNKDMAFLDVNDDTSSIDITVFDDKINLLDSISKNDFVKIIGRVERRFDKYSIILNLINKINAKE